MNEPWISSEIQIYLLPGIIGGISGLIVGPLSSIFIPIIKFKRLRALVSTILGFALSFILFVFGITAYLFGQPDSIWFIPVFFGFCLMVGASLSYRIVLKRARDAEVRKSMAEDLTLGGNKYD